MSPAACAPASPAADRVRDALGVTGGVLLAFCLVPQLWKIHRTKSATDIDYGWTALYAGGLIFNIAYLVLEGALVGWIFLIIETALILAVIAYKLALERPWRRRRKDGGGGGDDGIASVKLGDDAEGGAGSIIALTGR